MTDVVLENVRIVSHNSPLKYLDRKQNIFRLKEQKSYVPFSQTLYGNRRILVTAEFKEFARVELFARIG